MKTEKKLNRRIQNKSANASIFLIASRLSVRDSRFIDINGDHGHYHDRSMATTNRITFIWCLWLDKSWYSVSAPLCATKTMQIWPRKMSCTQKIKNGSITMNRTSINNMFNVYVRRRKFELFARFMFMFTFIFNGVFIMFRWIIFSCMYSNRRLRPVLVILLIKYNVSVLVWLDHWSLIIIIAYTLCTANKFDYILNPNCW